MLLRWTLPALCAVCRCWDTEPVCAACLARWDHPVPRCLRCAEPLPDGTASSRCGPATSSGRLAAVCSACRSAPPPQRRTIAALGYAFPWDGLIGRFKFQDGVELAGALSRRLADAVARPEPAVHDGPPADLVVPVPLSATRLRQRGYNQAWELARRVARRRHLPASPDLLLRPHDTAQQSRLARAERQANLRAAFSVAPASRAALAGRRVALVDDVMTSGSTVAEAAAELMRGGAASVDVWVLARTSQA